MDKDNEESAKSKVFSQKIQENATDDIEKLGLEIVNLNVQNVTDDNDAIVPTEDMVANLSQEEDGMSIEEDGELTDEQFGHMSEEMDSYDLSDEE